MGGNCIQINFEHLSNSAANVNHFSNTCINNILIRYILSPMQALRSLRVTDCPNKKIVFVAVQNLGCVQVLNATFPVLSKE